MKRKLDKKELSRKLFHIISILLLLIPLYTCGNYCLASILAFFVVVFFIISKFRIKNHLTNLYWLLLDKIERDENLKSLPAKQAFSLALSLILISLIFPREIVAISIITLAVYDGFSTIGGKFFGKTKLINNRTLEGASVGIIANTLVLMWFIGFWNALLVSVFAALLEMFSRPNSIFTDDNFTIPIGTALLVYLLMVKQGTLPAY